MLSVTVHRTDMKVWVHAWKASKVNMSLPASYYCAFWQHPQSTSAASSIQSFGCECQDKEDTVAWFP